MVLASKGNKPNNSIGTIDQGFCSRILSSYTFVQDNDISRVFLEYLLLQQDEEGLNEREKAAAAQIMNYNINLLLNISVGSSNMQNSAIRLINRSAAPASILSADKTASIAEQIGRAEKEAATKAAAETMSDVASEAAAKASVNAASDDAARSASEAKTKTTLKATSKKASKEAAKIVSGAETKSDTGTSSGAVPDVTLKVASEAVMDVGEQPTAIADSAAAAALPASTTSNAPTATHKAEKRATIKPASMAAETGHEAMLPELEADETESRVNITAAGIDVVDHRGQAIPASVFRKYASVGYASAGMNAANIISRLVQESASAGVYRSGNIFGLNAAQGFGELDTEAGDRPVIGTFLYEGSNQVERIYLMTDPTSDAARGMTVFVPSYGQHIQTAYSRGIWKEINKRLEFFVPPIMKLIRNLERMSAGDIPGTGELKQSAGLYKDSADADVITKIRTITKGIVTVFQNTSVIFGKPSREYKTMYSGKNTKHSIGRNASSFSVNVPDAYAGQDSKTIYDLNIENEAGFGTKAGFTDIYGSGPEPVAPLPVNMDHRRSSEGIEQLLKDRPAISPISNSMVSSAAFTNILKALSKASGGAAKASPGEGRKTASADRIMADMDKVTAGSGRIMAGVDKVISAKIRMMTAASKADVAPKNRRQADVRMRTGSGTEDTGAAEGSLTAGEVGTTAGTDRITIGKRLFRSAAVLPMINGRDETAIGAGIAIDGGNAPLSMVLNNSDNSSFASGKDPTRGSSAFAAMQLYTLLHESLAGKSGRVFDPTIQTMTQRENEAVRLLLENGKQTAAVNVSGSRINPAERPVTGRLIYGTPEDRSVHTRQPAQDNGDNDTAEVPVRSAAIAEPAGMQADKAIMELAQAQAPEMSGIKDVVASEIMKNRSAFLPEAIQSTSKPGSKSPAADKPAMQLPFVRTDMSSVSGTAEFIQDTMGNADMKNIIRADMNMSAVNMLADVFRRTGIYAKVSVAAVEAARGASGFSDMIHSRVSDIMSKKAGKSDTGRYDRAVTGANMTYADQGPSLPAKPAIPEAMLSHLIRSARDITAEDTDTQRAPIVFRYNPQGSPASEASPKNFDDEIPIVKTKVINETINAKSEQKSKDNKSMKIDIEGLANQVYRRLEDRLRTERQRRGLFR